MIKTNIKSYRTVGDEEKLIHEDTVIFSTADEMEKDCKNRTSSYIRVCGEVLHEWEDNDPVAIQEYFTQLVKRHDITYNYSDDHNVWRKGQQQRDLIHSYAMKLDRKVATDIWNKNIDESFTHEDTRTQFYWKV